MIQFNNQKIILDKEIFLKIPAIQIAKTGIHFLTGANGAGKTTFLHWLTQKIAAEHPTINLSIMSALHDYERMIPLQGQTFFSLYCKDPWAPDFEKEFSHLKTKLISTMSSGEFQALVLITLLTQKSDLLLMDEPFSHLNHAWADIFSEKIKAQSQFRSFLIVTHHLKNFSAKDSHYKILDQNLVLQ